MHHSKNQAHLVVRRRRKQWEVYEAVTTCGRPSATILHSGQLSHYHCSVTISLKPSRHLPCAMASVIQ